MSDDTFIGFTWDTSQFATDEYAEHISQTVREVLESYTIDITEWMKQNHKWRNRTGYTESNLDTQIVDNGEILELRMIVVTPYLEGWYPEKSRVMLNAGEWSVVLPAIDYFFPQIMEVVEGLIK